MTGATKLAITPPLIRDSLPAPACTGRLDVVDGALLVPVALVPDVLELATEPEVVDAPPPPPPDPPDEDAVADGPELEIELPEPAVDDALPDGPAELAAVEEAVPDAVAVPEEPDVADPDVDDVADVPETVCDGEAVWDALPVLETTVLEPVLLDTSLAAVGLETVLVLLPGVVEAEPESVGVVDTTEEDSLVADAVEMMISDPEEPVCCAEVTIDSVVVTSAAGPVVLAVGDVVSDSSQ